MSRVRTPLVLIADDSGVARVTLRAALVQQGYEVVEAEDGEQAVAAAADHRPDVILLDVEMPKLDGHQVLDALRDDPELRDIPVIVLSGRNDVGAVTTALRRGAHDFVSKPFADGDLTARVASALRARTILDDLRRRNTELIAFAWRASHDLKSPLAAIKGMAETITAYEDRLDAKTKHDLLDRIAAAADQAANLVESLLALARNAEAKPAAAAHTPDPEAVVRGVVEQCRLVDASVDVGPGSWGAIAVPASEFASVVQNLVVNAGFYGRSEDGVLRLTVTALCDDDVGEVTIVFSDEGSGVDADAAPMLFDPFVRGRQSRAANPRSTGIGLAIVRQTVERWGGQVELAESEVGARFVVTLPLSDREEGA